MTDQMCIACVAYLDHYPIMRGDWECEHSTDETAFMLALADDIHGPNPVGEFTDPGWRAAQFLDDAELAWSIGKAPYRIVAHPDPIDFGFASLALVNDDYLIGTRLGNGDPEEMEMVVRVGGWLAVTPESETNR